MFRSRNADSGNSVITNNQVVKGHIFVQGQLSTSSRTSNVIVSLNNIEASQTTALADFTWAVDLAYLANVQVSHNIIVSAPQGIHYSDIQGMVVSDNTLVNCTAPIVATGTNTGIIMRNNPGINPLSQYDQGSISGAVVFDRIKGDYITTVLTGDITIAIAPVYYVGETLSLKFTQDAIGGRTATWPGSVSFSGGSLSLSPTAGHSTVVTLRWDGGGWREMSRYQSGPKTDDLAILSTSATQLQLQYPGYNTVYQRNYQGELFTYLGGPSANPKISVTKSGSMIIGGLTSTGGATIGGVAVPSAPGVSTVGVAGSTTYGYAVSAVSNTGETIVSTTQTIATGNSILSATNYNRIAIAAVTGAKSYRVYRMSSAGSPVSTGLIGTVMTPTTTTSVTFDDTGLVATTAPLTTDTSLNTGIGVASATAKLHLAAGDISPSSAPLKLTSGALMTTPEVGAVEFSTDKFYGTITTGGTRKEFTLNEVALTPTRIPFVANGGTLKDNSALLFDDTNGRLGIGGVTPTQSLDVNGNERTSGSITAGIGVRTASGVTVTNGTGISMYYHTGGYGVVEAGDWGTTVKNVVINPVGGSVGIGKTPTTALDVNGTVTATAFSGTFNGNATNVTGIVAIANGGTGSSTQNFVDLSTTQTIGGAKTFSSAITSSPTNYKTEINVSARHLLLSDTSAAYNQIALRNFQGSLLLYFNHGSSLYHTIDATGNIAMANATNLVFSTATGTKIGTATNQKLSFYNAAPVVQPATTGTSTGFTANTGTAVNDASTFTGGVGTTAYRISDIVLALKNLGLLAM